MNRVSLIRRINLGNYEYFELFAEIKDFDEENALARCMALMNKGLRALGSPRIDTTKLRDK